MQADQMKIHGKHTVKTAATLLISFALYLSGCKDSPTGADDDNNNDNGTPRTSVPAALVDTWYTGNVSPLSIRPG